MKTTLGVALTPPTAAALIAGACVLAAAFLPSYHFCIDGSPYSPRAGSVAPIVAPLAPVTSIAPMTPNAPVSPIASNTKIAAVAPQPDAATVKAKPAKRATDSARTLDAEAVAAQPAVSKPGNSAGGQP